MTQPQKFNPLVPGLLASVIRTVVPIVVSTVVAWLSKYKLEIDSNLLVGLVTVVITTVYYALVRVLETVVAPAWGWLLGVAKVPAYPTVVNTTAVDATPVPQGPPFGD